MRAWMASCLLLSLLTAACAPQRPREPPSLLVPPPITDSNRDRYWKTGDPRDLGLDVGLLEEHLLLCKETGATSQLVVCRGSIVSEWYSERYTLPVYAMSSTKAVISLLIGILLDEGRIGRLSDRVAVYVPAWSGGLRGEVTIEQILTHSSGMTRRWKRGESVGYETDKTGFVLGLEPALKPGSRFEYSNEAVQLLDALIEAASGLPTARFAARALFDRLGMADTSLNLDEKGHAWTYADMRTTTRDMARIGQLMLEGGLWRGKRILGAAYIEKATSPSPTKKEMGYLWWILYDRGKILGYYASGYLNTDIYVLPRRELVIVRTQSPLKGYTGDPESGDYFERAVKLFSKLSR